MFDVEYLQPGTPYEIDVCVSSGDNCTIVKGKVFDTGSNLISVVYFIDDDCDGYPFEIVLPRNQIIAVAKSGGALAAKNVVEP